MIPETRPQATSTLSIPVIDKLLFGSAWYPEMWSKQRILNDLDLMAQAKMNCVRIAEFAWSFMEPDENQFDFQWLDFVLDEAGKRKISAIMCTPTEAPPPWLLLKHPDIQPIDSNGLRKMNGGRRGVNINHPAFIEASDRVTTAMAKHFGQNLHVIGWQLDNEPGCHSSILEYSEITERKFREWCRKKYGDNIAKVNHAWHTSFWSHVLRSFDDIVFFLNTRTGVSPQYRLDMMRFGSDCWKEFLDRQESILRKNVNNFQFVTTNWTWLQEELDWHAISEKHEFTSIDIYQNENAKQVLADDLAWSVKKKKHMVMEMPSGIQFGLDGNAILAAGGALRMLFYKHVLSNARGISTWRWDRAPGGQEMNHGAVVHHNGRPSRAYQDYLRFGKELQAVGRTLARNIKMHEVAFLHDCDSFLIDADRKWDSQRVFNHFFLISKELQRHGVHTAFVKYGEDWISYKMVIANEQLILDEEGARNVEKYVRAGGTFIALPQFGTLDRNGLAHTDEDAPAYLNGLFGARWDERDVPRKGTTFALQLEQSHATWEIDSPAWAISNKEATVLATFTHRVLKGEPAITCRQQGWGKAVLFGPELSSGNVKECVRMWADLAGVDLSESLPEGLEKFPGTLITGYVNHDGENKITHPLPKPGMDILSGWKVSNLTLEPYGVALIDFNAVESEG